MKAIVVRELGGPEQLELREVPDLHAGPGELLLRVEATALNRADLLQRRGLYPPPPGASELLGLECAGVVLARGDGNEGSPRVGDRVMALLPGGGYAEQVVIPERLAIPIPDGLDFEAAAAIPEAFLTAQEALFTEGRLEPGETVLVHAAAGGIGSATVQLAALHGARVLATAGGAEKGAFVSALGAQRVIDYKTESYADVVKAETGGRGVDVIVDFLGGKQLENNLSALAPGGRLVVVGLLDGAKGTLDLSKLLFKRLTVRGLVMRTRSVAEKAGMVRRFCSDSLPHFASGRLRPLVDRVFPVADAADAHRMMERNENRGKIVLRLR